jgi:hypothetical protein
MIRLINKLLVMSSTHKMVGVLPYEPACVPSLPSQLLPNDFIGSLVGDDGDGDGDGLVVAVLSFGEVDALTSTAADI